MPLNCQDNELPSGCVTYSGGDIPVMDIKFGDSMDTVISKIAAYIGSLSPTEQAPITTDNILSKGVLRKGTSILAANIIKRDFEYSLVSNGQAVVLNWNLTPVIQQLPPDYNVGLTKVIISGRNTNSSNVITDSKSPSANLTVAVDRFPVTVDFHIRVISPGGNIDMKKSIDLVNPAIQGSYRAILDPTDLNPQSGEIGLTEHLNAISGQIADLQNKQNSVKDVSPDVALQGQDIDSLKSTVEDPTTLPVSYTKEGTTSSAQIGTVLNDLYSQIKTLKDKDASNQQQINNLRSQLDTL